MFHFAFEYRKRLDCWPPLGEADVDVAIWQTDELNRLTKVVDIGRLKGRANPKDTYRESSFHFPALPVGNYLMQWSSIYTCSGIKYPPIDGPLVPFEIR